MNLFPRLVPLGLATLAVACSTQGPADPPDEFDAQSVPLAAQLSADLQTAQVNLPGVERIALTDQLRANYLIGELGESHEDVIAAFGQAAEATLVSEQVDAHGFTHQRFSQTIDGLPLVGGDIRIARNRAGEIVAASGVASRPSDISTAAVAVAAARGHAFANTNGANEIDEGSLVYVAGSNLSPTLAWQFLVRGFNQDIGLPIDDLVFVSALDGVVLARHSGIHTAKNRETRDAEGTDTAGVIARTEGQGTVGDADVDAAHDAAGDTYDCINDLLGRDSYDGLGAMLVSIVDYDNISNAFWRSDVQAMFYGPAFAEADIGTHELGHALTNLTANLIYENESGALNEASSDVLVAICDIHKSGQFDDGTWLIAEDLAAPDLTGPIRSMKDPASDNISTDHYSTRFTGPEDNGGVHLNSGIYNLYFVLVVDGGRHPRRFEEQQVEGIGFEAAGDIHLLALTRYMNQATNFAGGRMANESAAIELYGDGSDEHISVQEAFFAVGVGAAPMARPVCGNSEIERDEVCDDGNNVDGDGCNASCAAEVCGDSVINNSGAETCDDGNVVDGDGCDALCSIEEAGCGCSTDPSAPVGLGWLLLLGAIGFATGRRRLRNR